MPASTCCIIFCFIDFVKLGTHHKIIYCSLSKLKSSITGISITKIHIELFIECEVCLWERENYNPPTKKKKKKLGHHLKRSYTIGETNLINAMRDWSNFAVAALLDERYRKWGNWKKWMTKISCQWQH